MAGEQDWDHSVDVLVVGSGNGGLTAALCCYEMGTKDVLVIEKSELFGGTSSISGGGVWIPCNRYAQAAGAQDSLENAKTYLSNCIPAERGVPEEMIDAYLENGHKMVDFLHERTQVRYVNLEHYPDYYSDQEGAMPGHRSMEPETINADKLGSEFRTLRRTHPMMHLGGLIGFTQVEAALLMAQMPGWVSLAMKMVLNYILDIPWRLFGDKYARRLATGCAGVARLRVSMQDRDMPLWLKSPMKSLITEDGRVIGAVIEKEGRTMRVQARKAVILAAGGFEHNQEMREKYLPRPTNRWWSAGHQGNTGDAINECLKLGAQMHMLDSAWWCNTISVPGETIPRLSIMEKSYPGSIVVNPAGERFSNESQNYMAYTLETFELHSDENPCVPSWQIFDANFRATYFVGPMYNSKMRPDWMLPSSYEKEGFFAIGETIRELADKIDVDPDGLEQTVMKFNGYAESGKDLDLQRGDALYDRYYGDPRVEPNPCLGPVAKAPFYAMKIDPGDFGTQGGMVTTPNAEVVHESGTTIPGLYAIGNCSAAVLPNYPGPGSTLGPAMTFGYQAAKHICNWQG
jgi:3-oxosteroid 1-dehydrogenase